LEKTGIVFCQKKVKIHGNIDSSGDVKIEDETNIAGKISAEKIFLSKTSIINGELFAKNGISFKSPSKIQAEEKVERFEKDTDIVDEVDSLLE
jgi:predicted acyltransferase (DUF342 family)